MTSVPAVLLAALISVESSGVDTSKGDWDGKEHRAVGCLQIWKVVVDDVNRISGKSFKYGDRTSRAKSVEMAQIYLSYYGGRIGRKATVQDLANIWNKGPRGWTTCQTQYWKKVQRELDRPR